MDIVFDKMTFYADGEKIFLKSVFGLALKTGYGFVDVQVSGENKDSHACVKMINSSEGRKLRYVSHQINGDVLKIVQRSDLIEVSTFFTRYKDTETVRVYNEIKNVSDREIVLEEASTFVLYCFSANGLKDCDDLYFTRFIQSHHSECQPKRYSFYDLGLFYCNLEGQKRISFANVGSWSTKEELPQGIIENAVTGEKIMFQIESNNSWYYEISDRMGEVYLYLGGGNLTFGGWSKMLKPQDVYATDAAALSYGKSLDGVIGEMTKYRRHITNKRIVDDSLPVIFNEYMHLSWDSPTEKNTYEIAPIVASLGADYYVIDCGWHNEEDGNIIYPYVGQWKESKKRFPKGLKATLDYIKSLGLKPGLWIEPEIIGIKCEEMLSYYDDDCFLKRNGKKIAVMNRYFLDFRAKKVVDYLSETIRRIVEDYGAEYIKMDYNQDMGVGTDGRGEYYGEGLQEAQKAYLVWAADIIRRYPKVIFETCSSGGMRMDYRTLSFFDMVSTSDQTSYLKYPYIAGNVFSAVLPEQAGVWSYPVNSYGTENEPFEATKDYVDLHVSKETVIMNMVNAILGRIHLASHVELLFDDKRESIREGIRYYHKLAETKKRALPVFPLGFTDFKKDNVAVGLKDGKTIYLAVWHLRGDEKVDIPLDDKIVSVKIGYPENLRTEYGYEGNVLSVLFNEREQARIFEIILK